MAEFLVKWETVLDAEDPHAAAVAAQGIHRPLGVGSEVFTVQALEGRRLVGPERTIDLHDDAEHE